MNKLKYNIVPFYFVINNNKIARQLISKLFKL
jgi:hypothetical protein